jgi:hypothetical protein
LEECCKEQGQLAEASKEGLGSEWAVVPMMMMMMMMMMHCSVFFCTRYISTCFGRHVINA